jgi:hypothetical protein
MPSGKLLTVVVEAGPPDFANTHMSVFREAGLVTWAAGDKLKSRSLWETALNQSKFDFEYRLAVVSVF